MMTTSTTTKQTRYFAKHDIYVTLSIQSLIREPHEVSRGRRGRLSSGRVLYHPHIGSGEVTECAIELASPPSIIILCGNAYCIAL